MSNSDASSMVYYSPSPGAYAVIQLNPMEMVTPFQDPDALAQARAMKTKRYLVYLHWEMALPLPDQPWYRFEVLPIAPTLRPEDCALGITSDMCIPIYPNTAHPHEREPVRPEPEGLFPYGNCYHWFETTANVRVRSRPEEFDETHAVTLPAMGYVKMQQAFIQCGLQMCENRDATEEDEDSQPAHVHLPTQPMKGRESHMNNAGPVSADTTRSEELECVSSRSSSDLDPTSPGRHSVCSVDSLANVVAMDIFSGPNDDVELIPLVDMWISELGDHLKQEDIPSPLDMFAEFAEIARIVQEARVRSYAALTALAPDVHADCATGWAKSKRFRLFKPWTKLRTGVRRLSLRLIHVTNILLVRS
ncbi:hypothetical protein GY45DRAFT_1327006 [Cubamyces sp. BRFM 1775]|nr:hypothetical protein GY45DRAFT_1327006 [Cubamyces sp. BRFM 1775]